MYRVLFEPPTDAIAGLATGQLERVGSVIRHAGSGRIAYHLREVSAIPTSTFPIKGLPPTIQQHLGLASSATSVLNLGATVAFGAATIHKLNKIDRKMDRIIEKLDVMESKLDELNLKVQKLSWAVDLGFASTLRSLSVLERFGEAEIIGQLTSASQSAWSCQFLEPGSPQRMMRIENALSTVGVATERLAHIAYAELDACIEALEKSQKLNPSIQVGEDVFKALLRIRQLAVACSLRAHIMCESSDVYSAAALLKVHSARLNTLLNQLARTYLKVGELDIYQQLLSSNLSSIVPTARLDYWVNRFDPSIGGVFGLMDAIRSKGEASRTLSRTSSGSSAGDAAVQIFSGVGKFLAAASESRPANSSKNNSVEAADSVVGGFIDLVDACWEDIDRLCGHAIEMEHASTEASSWQDYRQSLLLEDAPSEAAIAFIGKERVGVVA